MRFQGSQGPTNHMIVCNGVLSQIGNVFVLEKQTNNQRTFIELYPSSLLSSTTTNVYFVWVTHIAHVRDKRTIRYGLDHRGLKIWAVEEENRYDTNIVRHKFQKALYGKRYRDRHYSRFYEMFNKNHKNCSLYTGNSLFIWEVG